MNKALVPAIVFLACAPAAAVAQERAGDAALGAVSGAVVLGPIGAVAGALVGYTAGPSISHAWGLRHSRSANYRQRPRGEANRAPASTVTPSAPPSAPEAARDNGRVAQAGASSNRPAQASSPQPTPSTAPPVQGF